MSGVSTLLAGPAKTGPAIAVKAEYREVSEWPKDDTCKTPEEWGEEPRRMQVHALQQGIPMEPSGSNPSLATFSLAILSNPCN